MRSAQREQLTDRAKAALAARERLHRHYRKTKEAQITHLCDTDRDGAKLGRFILDLGRFRSIDDDEDFMQFIYDSETQWLCRASKEVRDAALSLAAKTVLNIRVGAGLAPFDDPLPTSDDDIFQTVRQVLGEPN